MGDDRLAAAVAAALIGGLLILALLRLGSRPATPVHAPLEPVPLLESIRARRSVFPRSYVQRSVRYASALVRQVEGDADVFERVRSRPSASPHVVHAEEGA